METYGDFGDKGAEVPIVPKVLIVPTVSIVSISLFGEPFVWRREREVEGLKQRITSRRDGPEAPRGVAPLPAEDAPRAQRVRDLLVVKGVAN